MILLPLLLLLAAGCDGRFPFEDTNPDPHPPRLLNFEYSPDRIVSEGIVSGSFTYADSGGDVELFEMRDANGGTISLKPLFPDTGEEGEEVSSTFFFPGTTGTIEWEMTLASNQLGSHRIQAWLEDSKGSFSNTVEFVVDIVLPTDL
jgi:hypothetical protein